MFRTLIYPPSGACHYSVELPHWSYCSWFDVCWSFGVVGLGWYPCCRLKLCFSLQRDTTPTQPHRNSNTHRTKNNTTNVVIQQNSGKLLIMDILMSETCWANKTWNKIASDIKLVFYSSTSNYAVLTSHMYIVFRLIKHRNNFPVYIFYSAWDAVVSLFLGEHEEGQLFRRLPRQQTCLNIKLNGTKCRKNWCNV